VINLIGRYKDYEIIYDLDRDVSQSVSSFDIFSQTRRCFVFMKPISASLDRISRLCATYKNDQENHVVIWKPNASLKSKLLKVEGINVLSKDFKISKKDISSHIRERFNKTKMSISEDALKSFSSTIGASDYSYDINYDVIEMKYRPLALKCMKKRKISPSDIYEVIGDEVFSDDNSLFSLYSKGQMDLFFYILKDKIKNKREYEKDIFILKIINYFEHETRLKLMIASMMLDGMSDEDIANNILMMKKLKTGKSTYTRNQIKFFISRISSDNASSIKKANEFRLIALNSCRKILRSNSNVSFKDTHISFVIMYLVDKVEFRDFYNIVSRLKIREDL